MSNSCSHPGKFDLQGHRGARGLMPENTIPAFEKALQLGVNTLEMDVLITKDLQVLVSHDPWFNTEFCADANGERIPESEEQNHLIYQMTYGNTTVRLWKYPTSAFSGTEKNEGSQTFAI